MRLAMSLLARFRKSSESAGSRRGLAAEDLERVWVEAARVSLRGSSSLAGLLSVVGLLMAWTAAENGRYGVAAFVLLAALLPAAWRLTFRRRFLVNPLAGPQEYRAGFREYQLSLLLSGGMWLCSTLFVYPLMSPTLGITYALILGVAIAISASSFTGAPWTLEAYAVVQFGALAWVHRTEFGGQWVAVALLVIASLGIRAALAHTSATTVSLAVRLSRASLARKLWAERARRRIANERLSAENAKRRAAEARALFVARVSHELRSPLQTVASATELLQMRLDPAAHPNLVRPLNQLANATEQLLLHAHELSDFIRWDSGQVPVRLADVDVRPLLGDVVANLQARAQARGLRLDLHLEDAPAIWRTDPQRLRAIVTNLLTNAVKYTAQGGARVEARVQADGALAVTVADTGPGLPQAVQAALYKPWVQAEDASRPAEGFGLGLSIVQALAQELGASLAVESSAAGTRFTLVLPAA